jgi:hypothetical protein
VRFIPGILGALLVVAGVAVIFWPLALIVAGGFLLVVDRRLTLPPVKPRPARVEVR